MNYKNILRPISICIAFAIGSSTSFASTTLERLKNIVTILQNLKSSSIELTVNTDGEGSSTISTYTDVSEALSQIEAIVAVLNSDLLSIKDTLGDHGSSLDIVNEIQNEEGYNNSMSNLGDMILYANKAMNDHNCGGGDGPISLLPGHEGVFYQAVLDSTVSAAAKNYACNVLNFSMDYCYSLLKLGRAMLVALEASEATSWTAEWKSKVQGFYKAFTNVVKFVIYSLVIQ
ncbi:MAG: hypothetical protein LBP31_02900 [Holosporales bacterium]|jgi:hypothetical protein|nr:hypothetical protein [Holosporales bacterium]